MPCAAVVSFPNARGDGASKWVNECAWGEQNHFAPLTPFAKGCGGRGREFISFALNYPHPFLTVFPFTLNFIFQCLLHRLARQSKTFFF